MRIVHVYKDSSPPVFGGIEQHIALLAREQVRRGHEVELVVAGAGRAHERQEVDGVLIRRVPELGRLASSPLTLGFVPALRRVRADVAHFHHPNPVGEIAEPALSRETVRAMTYHADITRQRLLGAVYAPLRRRVVRRMDVLFAASPPIIQTSPILREHEHRVRIVPYGVDASRSEFLAARDPGRFLFVGRLREYKGLPVLFRAIAQLDGAHLRLVGRGPLERPLRRAARRLGITGRVTFLGDVTQDELEHEYQQARALVLPSTRRSEAFGIVIAEALMRGTPCISTELGTGTSWINQHERTGLVVEAGDAGSLRAALQRLVWDDAAWARYAAGALERARAFTLDVMTTAVLDGYGSGS